jgi:hypothetical protein
MPSTISTTVTTISMGIDGDLAISGGMVYYLTPCCKASATGCADYVGCRACYKPVADALGDGWMADDAAGWERRIAFLVTTGGLPQDMATRWADKVAQRARELASV